MNELGGSGEETKRTVAVAIMQKEKLEPELGNQDRGEGNKDERYPCKRISSTW